MITVIPTKTKVVIDDAGKKVYGHITGIYIGLKNVVGYEIGYFYEGELKSTMLSEHQFEIVKKKRVIQIGFKIPNTKK